MPTSRFAFDIPANDLVELPEPDVEQTPARGVRPRLSAQEAEAYIAEDTRGWRQKFSDRCFTSGEVAEERSSKAKNRAAVASRWLREGKVFAVRYEGRNRFPRFQFQNGEPIPAVARTIQIFPKHATGWDLAYFFVTPNSNIGGREPLELLRSDPDRVVSLARAFVHPADVF